MTAFMMDPMYTTKMFNYYKQNFVTFVMELTTDNNKILTMSNCIIGFNKSPLISNFALIVIRCAVLIFTLIFLFYVMILDIMLLYLIQSL